MHDFFSFLAFCSFFFDCNASQVRLFLLLFNTFVHSPVLLQSMQSRVSVGLFVCLFVCPFLSSRFLYNAIYTPVLEMLFCSSSISVQSFFSFVYSCMQDFFSFLAPIASFSFFSSLLQKRLFSFVHVGTTFFWLSIQFPISCQFCFGTCFFCSSVI